MDVTGRSGAAVKRLEARVGQGASPAANDFPGYALRSAAAVCKRLDVESNPSRISVGSAYCNLSLPCPASDTVDCPAPTVSLRASSRWVYAGGRDTLSWSSTNASSCSAGWMGSSATSGSASVSPGSTTTYTITCSGYFGGSASASVTVDTYQPVTVAFNLGPQDTTQECKYQWQDHGSKGKYDAYGGTVYNPWPYDYYWCKANDTRPKTPYTIRRAGTWEENQYDLPMPGFKSEYSPKIRITQKYPSFCPGRSTNHHTTSAAPNCDTYQHQTAHNCADGVHQYTTCQGSYSVSGGYGNSASCSVADPPYGTRWTSGGYQTTPYTVSPLNGGWGGQSARRLDFNVTLASSVIPPGGGSGGGGANGPLPPTSFTVTCSDGHGSSASRTVYSSSSWGD